MKMLNAFLLLIALSIPAMAADVAPLHFDGVDDENQQAYWNQLMSFKLWGTNSLEIGRVSIPDETGAIGTGGDFILRNDGSVIGGGIYVGGNLEEMAGRQTISSGPVRVKGDFYGGQNVNTLKGLYCIEGAASEKLIDFATSSGGTVFVGENAQKGDCSYDNVPDVPSELFVPRLPEVLPENRDFRGAINVQPLSNQYLDIPPVKGIYDVYLSSLSFYNEATLIIRLASTKTLVRIFIGDELQFSSVSQVKIAIVDKDAVYESISKVWENVSQETMLTSGNYPGNVLFYVNHDVVIPAMSLYSAFYGSIMSPGKISVGSNFSIIGQIIANELVIDNDFNGENFAYIPYDPPVLELNTLDLSSLEFIEGDEAAVVPISLNEAAATDVTFDYCFDIPSTALNGYADESDFNLTGMPLCSKNQKKAVVISAGSKTPVENIVINVTLDALVESKEIFTLKISGLAGAVLPGGSREGSFTLTIVDSGDGVFENHAPVILSQEFVVNENALAGAIVGSVEAADQDVSNGTYGQLTFSIPVNDDEDPTNDVPFIINSKTGMLSVAFGADLDYEKVKLYSFDVVVSDGGDGTDPNTILSATAEITIKVKEVKEINPIVSGAAIAPLYFASLGANYAADPDGNESYWAQLMKYKIFGAHGILFRGQNIRILDQSGWFGTADGDWDMSSANNRHVVGGPILVGGDILLSNGQDSITTGPVRVIGDIKSGGSDWGTSNVVKGNQCVTGSVDGKYVAIAEKDGAAIYSGANYSNCPPTVPALNTDLRTPDFEYLGQSVRPAISINNGIAVIDVPKQAVGEDRVYDIFVEKITLSNSSVLCIRMPAGGRLTRIFIRDGFEISAHPKIRIVYMDSDVSWVDDANGGRWDAEAKWYGHDENGVGWSVEKSTAIENKDYAGNLLFHTQGDIAWPAIVNSDSIQGTFIAGGTISVEQHMTLAGQLLADKVSINAMFDGSSFHYVPFDPPVISEDPEKSIPVTADVVIDGVEDIPVVMDLSIIPYANEDESLLMKGLVIKSKPGNGSLSYFGKSVILNQMIPADSLSKLIFTAEKDEFGDDYASFSFVVVASNDQTSEKHSITINVLPVNDAPTAADMVFTIPENSASTVTSTEKSEPTDVDDTEFTYAFDDTDENYAKVSELYVINADGTISPKEGAELDYESADSVLTIKVIVTDAASTTAGIGKENATFTAKIKLINVEEDRVVVNPAPGIWIRQIGDVATHGSFKGSLYYSRYTQEDRIKSIHYQYDETNGLSLDTLDKKVICAMSDGLKGSSGITLHPDGDLLVAGQGTSIYKVNKTAREEGGKCFVKTATPASSTSGFWHLTMDPTQKVLWGTGIPGQLYRFSTEVNSAVKNLADKGFQVKLNPATTNLRQDAQLTSVVWDGDGTAFFTYSDYYGGGCEPNVTTGSLCSESSKNSRRSGAYFGIFTDTTWTKVTSSNVASVGGTVGDSVITALGTKILIDSLEGSHGAVYDPYSQTIFITGGSKIVQIRPYRENGVVSAKIVAVIDMRERFFVETLDNLTLPRTMDGSYVGWRLDQCVVDGFGHLFVSSISGHVIFVDYASNPRKLIDDDILIHVQWLDNYLDGISIVSGVGSDDASDYPVGADVSIAALEDTPYIFTAFPIFDTEGNDISNVDYGVIIKTLPESGSITLDGRAIEVGKTIITKADIEAGKLVLNTEENDYTTTENANKFDIEFFVVDEKGNSAMAYNTVFVTVAPVNDAPTAVDMTFTIPENSAATVKSEQKSEPTDVDDTEFTFAFDDTDENYAKVSELYVINADGTISPKEGAELDYESADSVLTIKVIVTDAASTTAGVGKESATFTATIKLTDVNEDPVVTECSGDTPFCFENASEDQQLSFWNDLVKYKMFGAHGIYFMGQQINIPDESGWFGTADGDFDMSNANVHHTVGGPIMVGGNLILSNGYDSLSSGPVRVLGDVRMGYSVWFNGVIRGDQCVQGAVATEYVRAVEYGDVYSGVGYESCPSSVPQINESLRVPEFVYDGVTVPRPAISINNGTAYIDVPDGSGVYDVLLEKITFSNNAELVIRMPAGGRLTRIILREGIEISGHPNIHVQYMSRDAVYDETTNAWTSGTATSIANKDYAGNLLFFMNTDLAFPAITSLDSIQGTFISTGKISIEQHMTLAGQLLADVITINSEFDGSGFRYVPFDPPRLDPVLFTALDFVENNEETEVAVRLSQKALTNVTFSYCFEMSSGISENGMTEDRMTDVSDFNMDLTPMPICGVDTGVVVILIGTDEPTEITKIWINVKQDSYKEEYSGNLIQEILRLRVIDLQGAVMDANEGDGFIDLNIVDVYVESKPPHINTDEDEDGDDDSPTCKENCTGHSGDKEDGMVVVHVKENVPTGTVVFEYYLEDEDEDDKTDMTKLVATLTDNDTTGADSLFDVSIKKVGDDYKVVVTVKDSSKLDFEKIIKTRPDSSFVVTLTVADPDDPKLSDSIKRTIVIDDVNEMPILAKQNFMFYENNAVGSVVGAIIWDDVDSETSNFRLDEFTVVGGDLSLFAVSKDGVITTKKSFDYEADKAEYSLVVKLADKAEHLVATIDTIKIKLVNLLEHAAVEITVVDDGKNRYARPDSVFTNQSDIAYCWSINDIEKCVDTTLAVGIHKIVVKDSVPSMDIPGIDSVIIVVSSASPTVEVVGFEKGEPIKVAEPVITIRAEVQTGKDVVRIENKIQLDTIAFSERLLSLINSTRNPDGMGGNRITIDGSMYVGLILNVNGLHVTAAYAVNKDGLPIDENFIVRYEETTESGEVYITYKMHKSGKAIRNENGDVAFNVQPRLDFDGFKYEKDLSVSVSFPESDVVKTVVQKPQISLETVGRSLSVNGARVGEILQVYDMKGKIVASKTLHASNTSVEMPVAGKYIVRIGKNTRIVNIR